LQKCEAEDGCQAKRDLSSGWKIHDRKIMFTNVDSLRNKMTELEALVTELDFDVIGITELNNKTNSEIDDWTPVLIGYSFYADTFGRGVGLFVRNSLNVVRRPELEDLFHPSVFCDINFGHDILHFGVIYRSPRCNLSENEKINQLITSFFGNEHLKGIKVLVGDFNYPDIDWMNETCSCGPTKSPSLFLKSTLDSFAVQLIHEPTHFRPLQNPTCIDLVLCSDPSDIFSLTHHPPIGKSHHSVISFDIKIAAETVKITDRGKFYFMDKGEYESIRKHVGSVDWNLLLNDKSVDECWNEITEMLLKLRDRFIPSKNFSSGTKRKCTVPAMVLEKIREKRRA